MDILRIKMNAAQEMDAVEEAVNGALKGVWTSLPAIISEDSDGHTAKAQSAVKLAITLLDGTVKMTSFPPFDTAPVHYPNGGGHHFTHPVKKGDEGVVHFTSRAQDLWHEKGGEQDPVDNRTHHLADGRWHPGGRSKPRKLDPPASSVSAQQRSDDGNHVSDVNKDSGITHASTKKHLVSVGGKDGAGTVHLASGKVIKNSQKVLINSVEQDPLPPPGMTIANKKQVAGKPIGAMGPASGAIAGIMKSVMSGGIGSLLSSPTAGASGGLTSAISAAVSAVSGVGGSGGLTSALGGLSGAVGTLESAVGAMSGASTPGAGQFGLTDLLSHAEGLSQFFGGDPPAGVGMSTVLAPLLASPTLAGMMAQIQAIAAAVVGGTTSPTAAAATVSGLTTQLTGLLSASAGALTSLQTAMPALQLATLAGSAGVSQNPSERAIAGALAGPQLAALTDAMAQIFALSGEDVASITAFPDPQGGGATGGVPPS
jgi:hypothetical protein